MGVFDEPADHLQAITPSDTTILDVPTRGIYVGVAGDVSVTDEFGHTVVFLAVPVGVVLPVRVKRILATNTTATNLIAMW
jgi:hypothetical protein